MFRLKPYLAFIALTTLGSLTPWAVLFVKWINWRITVWPNRVESYEEAHEKWLADPFRIGEPEPVFPQDPFTDLNIYWLITPWVLWSIPFILLGLLAWFLLHRNYKRGLTYKNIYIVIGCSAISGWIAMIISFENAWLGYTGFEPWEVLLFYAAFFHGVFTFVGLITGLILSLSLSTKGNLVSWLSKKHDKGRIE